MTEKIKVYVELGDGTGWVKEFDTEYEAQAFISHIKELIGDRGFVDVEKVELQ